MNWVLGQRVCREEAPEQVGTVTDINSVEIKVRSAFISSAPYFIA
jgi:hypothetical protein